MATASPRSVSKGCQLDGPSRVCLGSTYQALISRLTTILYQSLTRLTTTLWQSCAMYTAASPGSCHHSHPAASAGLMCTLECTPSVWYRPLLWPPVSSMDDACQPLLCRLLRPERVMCTVVLRCENRCLRRLLRPEQGRGDGGDRHCRAPHREG